MHCAAINRRPVHVTLAFRHIRAALGKTLQLGRLASDGEIRLHGLMIEIAPVLLVFEQLVVMPLHGLGPGTFGHSQCNIGNHDLRGFLDTGGTRELECARHIVSEKRQHQHVGLELPVRINGSPKSAVFGARETSQNTLVDVFVLRSREPAD